MKRGLNATRQQVIQTALKTTGMTSISPLAIRSGFLQMQVLYTNGRFSTARQELRMKRPGLMPEVVEQCLEARIQRDPILGETTRSTGISRQVFCLNPQVSTNKDKKHIWWSVKLTFGKATEQILVRGSWVWIGGSGSS